MAEQISEVPEQLDHRDGGVIVRCVAPAAHLHAGAVDQLIERMRLLRPPHDAYDTRTMYDNVIRHRDEETDERDTRVVTSRPTLAP